MSSCQVPLAGTAGYSLNGCFCCCSHINSHNQVRGHRTGSSHSGAEEYPRENTHSPRWYTHVSQPTQFMPPPETYRSEIGSQSTMCQVQAGAYVSLGTTRLTVLTVVGCNRTATTSTAIRWVDDSVTLRATGCINNSLVVHNKRRTVIYKC